MSEHRIDKVRGYVVSIPTKAVHSHGSGDVGAIRSVLVEIVTESGVTGWGEASPWAVFTGTVEGAAAALRDYFAPALIGKNPIQIGALMTMADEQVVGHPEAKAALECALLDIVGQVSGLTIAELLGGLQRSSIPLSFSVANPDFDQDLEDVERLWSEGVRLFKLKTGFKDHRFDLFRLEKLRSTYGDEIDLRVDYNQGLPAYDAVRTIKDLEAFRPTFVEQPTKRHERDVLAAITKSVDVPIMADESVFNPRDAVQGVRLGISDIFSLKIMKSGGMRSALEVAAIARAAGIEVYGGCMFETSVAHAAGAHLMAAVPQLKLGCEFYMSTYYAADDIAVEPFPVIGGNVVVPTKPGLGLKPDVQKITRYSTDQFAC